MSVATKQSLVTLMSSPNHIYEGWHVLPGGGASEFENQWADVADLLFAGVIPVSGSATTARAAFIAAMAHAVSNSKLKRTLEMAFLAYLQNLESAMQAGTFVAPIQPYLTDLSQNIATLGSLESNQWAIDTISGGLVSWALANIATLAPPAITGNGTITASAGANHTRTLSNTITGGVWTSATTGVATVNATTGVVTGVAVGTSVITYTVTNEFGTSNFITAIATVTT